MTTFGRPNRYASYDAVIDSQPILWAQALLDDAERCKSQEARDGILTRIGVVFVTRFGIFSDADNYRYSPAEQTADEDERWAWIPRPAPANYQDKAHA